MEEKTDPLDELVSLIKRQRDELKLKIHLGKKDAQDEWNNLESKWKDVEQKTQPLTGAVQEAASTAGEQAKNVTGAALDLAAKELKAGYEKLRKLLE